MKVWIDPGHGGSASGAVKGSRMEKDDTLKLAKLVKAAFERCGISTVMTRTTDVFVSLKDRTDLENKNNCDLAVSLHRNSAADSSACGVETWMHSKAPASYIKWGEDVLKELEKVGVSKNRGVKKGFTGDANSDYAVNRDTKSPSMMIELGFISNDKDNGDYDKNLNAYSEAIVKACCNYLGAKYTENKPASSGTGNTTNTGTNGGTLYRVQVGAFENKENAEKLRDELKAKGYSAFIS